MHKGNNSTGKVRTEVYTEFSVDSACDPCVGEQPVYNTPADVILHSAQDLEPFFFFCVERKIGGGFSRFGTCVRFPAWGNLRTPLLFRKNPPAPLIAVSWGSRHFIERRFIEHRFVEAVLRNPLHRTIFCLWTFVAASSSRL